MHTTNTHGWIGGPWFDAFFFFGSGVFAVALGLLMWALPATVLPLFFLWIGLIEGPHVVATWQRTYFDAQCRQQQRGLLVGSLFWFVPGLAMLMVSKWFDRPEVFALFLGAAALWSFHHLIRQHHGLLAIYQRLSHSPASSRREDKVLLHAVLWIAFVLFQLTHPTNRRLWGLTPDPEIWGQAITTTLLALLVALVIGWGALLVLRFRQGLSVKPGVFALVIAAGTTLFSLLGVGLQEPIFPTPLTIEQVFLAAGVVGGTVHGLQYLGLVLLTSARRVQNQTPRHWSEKIQAAPALAYSVMMGVSLLYVGLNLLRGMPLGLPPSSDVAQIFLALYWGLFLHHYWLDQKIWHPSRDGRLRAELGV
jgi:hypothetical protein